MVLECDSCRYPSWIGNDADIGSIRSSCGFFSLCGFSEFPECRRGNRELKHSAAVARFMQNHAAAMFLRDLLGQREAQPGAAGLAYADKGLEQGFADGLGHARAVVGDEEQDLLGGFRQGDANLGSAASLARG